MKHLNHEKLMYPFMIKPLVVREKDGAVDFVATTPECRFIIIKVIPDNFEFAEIRCNVLSFLTACDDISF